MEFRNLSKRILGEELVIKTKPDNEIVAKKESSKSQESGQLDLFGAQSMLEERDPEETASLKTIVTEKAKYHLVNEEDQLKELIKLLHTQKEVCFDTETTSLDARNAELVGISFSFKSKEAFYVPIPESLSLIHI